MHIPQYLEQAVINHVVWNFAFGFKKMKTKGWVSKIHGMFPSQDDAYNVGEPTDPRGIPEDTLIEMINSKLEMNKYCSTNINETLYPLSCGSQHPFREKAIPD